MSELQTYALSVYPGECRMVKNHPSNDADHYYKRGDVDAVTSDLRTKLAAAEAELKALREDKERLIELLNEAIRSIVPLAHTTHLHYPPECTACKYDKKVRLALDSARSQNK